MSEFLETVKVAYFTGDYSGVTHAGIAVLAADTGRVLLAQRTMDETDDPEVQETWEWPGGHLDGDEEPMEAALREFSEEVVLPLPLGEVVNGWRAGPEDNYQGFVYLIPAEFPLDGFVPNEETQQVVWASRKDIEVFQTGRHPLGTLRPEMSSTDWDMIFTSVSGNEDTAMSETAPEPLVEPDLTWADLSAGPIPIHGVLAPEEVETGDGRGFNGGSMTSRPGILPFSWQKSAIGAHDGSVVTGGLTRLMRKDGLIHYEGMLMPSEDAGEFAGLLAFFGRFGVSVDGDMGSLDSERSQASGVTWFNAVRAAGLTAVAIPAFHEAYVAFGPHPDMPSDATLTASMQADGDLVTFDRGPGWVTNPVETKRLHDYWTKKGEEGYTKIRWGTPGDFTRAKKLIGAKIGANSPEDLKYLNQIIAQWHFDALGYWPGDLDKPGNKTTAEARAEREAAALHTALGRVDNEGLEVTAEADGWEAVLVSSVSGNRVKPPLDYFHYISAGADAHPLTIMEPDANGIRRVFGYAAKWGVCHIGFDNRCVEPPRTYSDDYPEFHLGTTKTEAGRIPTGVLTYGVDHRDSDTILRETPEQSYFDNINNAWASVRLGEDEIGVWFSGVVLPGVPEDHITKIEASGQVSGEWKYGAMRACLTVNVPGYPVEQPTATYDAEGNIMALAASAFGQFESDSPCTPTPKERLAALAQVMAEDRFTAAKAAFKGRVA